MSKELLLAIVEEDAASVMGAFDTKMIEKLELLIEHRKEKVAAHMLTEGGDGEDIGDDDEFEFDDLEDDAIPDEDEEVPLVPADGP